MGALYELTRESIFCQDAVLSNADIVWKILQKFRNKRFRWKIKQFVTVISSNLFDVQN